MFLYVNEYNATTLMFHVNIDAGTAWLSAYMFEADIVSDCEEYHVRQGTCTPEQFERIVTQCNE